MTKTAIATSPDEPENRASPTGRRRRANGEGMIYKRKDGRYEGAAYVLTTAGTQKRVRVYGKTREETRRKLTKLLEQSDQGIPVAAESWTLAEYLAYWLKHVVKIERRPKTYIAYEQVVRVHLVPGLGNKRLGKLAVRDVRVFITRVREQCQCCKHGWDAQRSPEAEDPADRPRCCAIGRCCKSRLSVRMVQFIHAVLRNALQHAVREEILPRNVAKLVRVPTPTYTVNRGLTVEQARKLLVAARDNRLYALYVLAVFLGLRKGELLGLRWCDVDLGARKLEVVQTLQRVDGRLRFLPPKTGHSARTVPLPGVCVAALKEHRERQAAERAQAGDAWREGGLVFTTQVGTPVDPDNFRRNWDRLRVEAGLGEFRFHDLRHTCVTLLLNLGVPPQVVRGIVGHSAIAVTMTIYAHASLEDQRRALNRLNDTLK